MYPRAAIVSRRLSWIVMGAAVAAGCGNNQREPVDAGAIDAAPRDALDTDANKVKYDVLKALSDHTQNATCDDINFQSITTMVNQTRPTVFGVSFMVQARFCFDEQNPDTRI